ncbi:MAG: type IVB secretion system coupling complex protein DotM/IcmP [Pseudomonadota bacterium]|nr:type IVB secretion system coupling complex protein DotM/IcmP [Pseudomonadota bacterium]
MAGQQQQQGGGGGGDNSLDFLWGIVLLIAAVLAGWYFFRYYIGSAVFAIRYYELVFINYSLIMYSNFAQMVHLPIPDTSNLLQALRIIIEGASPDMGFAGIATVSNIIGWYLAFPIALVLGILGFVVMQTGTASKFKRNFSHRTMALAKQEQKLWKMIAPIQKLDLVKEDINKGPWAMSTPPMAFAKQYDLLVEDRSVRPITVSIRKGSASRIFAMQLGPYFTGVENMPMHYQALFAMFAARGNRDSVTARKLFDQLSISYADGKIDYSGVKELLKKHINTKPVQFVIRRHAYMMTVMGSMIELSRADGVMACSEFLWLKPTDRRLWYMLSSIGRQTPFVEVSGAFAHWKVEKQINRPLRVPMVKQAVTALEVAVADVLYEPDEDDA